MGWSGGRFEGNLKKKKRPDTEGSDSLQEGRITELKEENAEGYIRDVEEQVLF
jgi:hypothetical protein